MSVYGGPNVSDDNLLLSLDFKNPKLFDSVGTNLVTHENYNASSWSTAFYKTLETGIDAPDGSKNAVRILGIVKSGTYTVTSNVATITITNHGLSGSNHYFDFTSGTAPDGFYTITTIVDANTFTIPITTSDTSGNVTVRYRCGQRLNLSAFTPNGTDTYTLSFWARLISSGNYGGSFTADLHDGGPSIDYTSQLISNTWVQVVTSAVPSNANKSFLDVISDFTSDFIVDIWRVKLENQTTDSTQQSVKDNISGYKFNILRPEYSRQTINDITFNRTTSPASKWGGGAYSTLSGNLTASNFLYNDHTMEVWFKINDRTDGNYDATEGQSILAAYRGYHAGFMYSSSNMFYYVWNGIANSPTCALWTLGTSGTQIIQGNWHQIVTVKSGSSFVPYINGEPSGTGYSPTISSTGIGTSNEFFIGCAGKQLLGAGSYLYYGKNSVSTIKLYNRSLSAAEVKQNFNALRGRFNI
jgi:hypothetical protein